MHTLVHQSFSPAGVRGNEVDHRASKISVKESYTVAGGNDIILDKGNNRLWKTIIPNKSIEVSV